MQDIAPKMPHIHKNYPEFYAQKLEYDNILIPEYISRNVFSLESLFGIYRINFWAINVFNSEMYRKFIGRVCNELSRSEDVSTYIR